MLPSAAFAVTAPLPGWGPRLAPHSAADAAARARVATAPRAARSADRTRGGDGEADAAVVAAAALVSGATAAALLGQHTRGKRSRRAEWSRRSVAVVRQAACKDFLSFVANTGSPAHTVLESKARLVKAGFSELKSGEDWKLQPGGLYFVTSEGTSIWAFAVGGKFSPKEGGVLIAAGHTDSPCLKVRPRAKLPSKAGTVQLGVDTYGGGLWHTWFDRPLGFAGKVVVASEPAGLEEKMVRLDAPLCLIPNLAIHLQTAEERVAFSFNKETHLRPVLCKPCGSTAPASKEKKDKKDKKEDDEEENLGPQQPEELLAEVAKAAGVKPEQILDVDLCLMDATPPCMVGEYVSSPRIDNVLSTWAAVDALAEFADIRSSNGGLKDSVDICCAASFDHEEVGSTSATGADSQILERWLDKALGSLGCSWSAVADRSFLLSCDCAHGLHPNYADKHQPQHQPLLGKGVVIKTNANQRYATTPILAQMVREVGKKDQVPIQEFVVRNDCPCGSTIGPLLSSQLGLRTVDVGAPQWAMHSCRETAHSADVESLQKLCLGLFKNFRAVDNSTRRL